MTGMTLAHQLVRGRRKVKIGGAREDRTPDLVNAIHALSQLSYGPISFSGWMLGSAHFTVNAQPKHHETSIT